MSQTSYKYIVESGQQVKQDIVIGSPGNKEKVLLGRLAETNTSAKIKLGADQEFVGLIVGKRGSGKSYTLGNIVEGFATKQNVSSISDHSRRRAVLLLDPMGNFWTMLHKVDPAGTAKVAEAHRLASDWPLAVDDIDVNVWIPAGFRQPHEPSGVREFRIRISDLSPADIADLLGCNLVKDPQGAALQEAFDAVVIDGWQGPNGSVPANPAFGLQDLVDYLEFLREAGDSDHPQGTLRALVRSLRQLQRQGVFNGQGTPLTSLFELGKVSVLMLPYRVGADLRKVITRLILRRTLDERSQASQIQQRLDVDAGLSPTEKQTLTQELSSRVGRAVLAIDEAQELLGDDGGEARDAIERFCLLGRNYGLSLLLATQRPSTGAISAKVRSQADIQLIHKLLTADDIKLASENLLASYPDKVLLGRDELDFAKLVRSLGRGQMVVSSSGVYSAGNQLSRIFIGESRPRLTVHGGEIG